MLNEKTQNFSSVTIKNLKPPYKFKEITTEDIAMENYTKSSFRI